MAPRSDLSAFLVLPVAKASSTRSRRKPPFRAASSWSHSAPHVSARSSPDRFGRDIGSERRHPRDGLTENEPMNVVRALVRVDRLEVGHVPHRVVLNQDAVGSQ